MGQRRLGLSFSLCHRAGIDAALVEAQFSFRRCTPHRNLKKSDAAFLLTVGSFLLTAELFYLQLTILAFLFTVGAFLLTLSAFLLTVRAFLLTVGKCV